VVAILAMLGVPQLQAFLKRQQVKADIDSLTSAVRLARSEAMKRSGVVSVCPLQSANASPPTCAVSPTVQSWSQGWIVFVDYAPLGALGDNDTILKVEQGTRTGKVISRRAMANMSFQSLGISTAANGSFNIGDDGLPSCKQLFLSRQGRARTSDCADTTDPDTP
jgi:type IV fimbrial biogenesis protein FimT